MAVNHQHYVELCKPKPKTGKTQFRVFPHSPHPIDNRLYTAPGPWPLDPHNPTASRPPGPILPLGPTPLRPTHSLVSIPPKSPYHYHHIPRPFTRVFTSTISHSLDPWNLTPLDTPHSQTPANIWAPNNIYTPLHPEIPRSPHPETHHTPYIYWTCWDCNTFVFGLQRYSA